MSKPTVAAIIVGIDGFNKYTLPLVESIAKYEPTCAIKVIDNASVEPYPVVIDATRTLYSHRTERLCYSAAINEGRRRVGDYDWYIVLSNDVLCIGPFIHKLEQYDGNDLVGPLMKEVYGFPYLEGWAIFVSRHAWDAVGGFDPAFLGSDWEDVDFSTSAREQGFGLIEDPQLPFIHLDQRQRFGIIEDFWGKNQHNQALFMRKHRATV